VAAPAQVEVPIVLVGSGIKRGVVFWLQRSVTVLRLPKVWVAKRDVCYGLGKLSVRSAVIRGLVLCHKRLRQMQLAERKRLHFLSSSSCRVQLYVNRELC